MSKRDDVKDYNTKLGQMKSVRNNYDSYWQDVADYTLPKRDFNTDRTQGEKRMTNLYDSTAIHATEQLASGLHGMLTPPSSKWFFLRAGRLSSNDNARAWLDGATDFLSDIFSSPESSFATSVFEAYLDLVAFGNAAMAVTFSKGRINFLTKKLRNCWVLENDDGEIDTIYICEKMSPSNMVRKFGIENVDDKVIKAYEGNQDVKFEVLHAIEPRKDNKGRGAAKNLKPFKSCFIDLDSKKVMKEDGFDDFPFLFPRMSKRSGETYGYGPGMNALAEVKELNKIAEIMTRAASKNIDPPVLSPAEGLILPLRLDPAGINFYNPDLGEPKFWQNGFQPNYFEAVLEYKRNLVNKMYYVDWMNLPQIDRQTTVEVMQRAQEGQRMMSPMLSRLHSEFLSKLIRRVLYMSLDNGLIPKPPEELQGSDVSIEYTSPMSIAQKATASQSVLQGLTVMAQLAQFDQSVAMRINADAIGKDQVLNTYAWPVGYIRSDEEMLNLQQQQAEAAAQAQQAAQTESLSKSAKNISGAYAEIQNA